MLAASTLLAACGGGGSDAANTASSALNDSGSSSTSTSAPSGSSNAGSTSNTGSQNTPSATFPTTVIASVFGGTNSAARPLTILLQDDGSYFIVYSDPTSGNPSGVILGTGTLNSGSFASTNGLDLALTGVGGQLTNGVTLSASYTEKSAFNGSVTYTDNRVATFTSSYNNAYETLPSLSTLAGVYTGSIANKSVREDNIVLEIAADGKVTGHLTCGCAIAAQLQAQGSAYAATLDFKSGSHPLSGKSFGGNVYLDSAAKRLYIVGKMTGTEDRVVFVGTKSS